MTKEALKKFLDKKIQEGAHHFDYNSLGFRHTPEVIIYGRVKGGKHEHRLDVRTLTEEIVGKLIDEIEEYHEIEKRGEEILKMIDEVIASRPKPARTNTIGNIGEDHKNWKKGLSKWRPVSDSIDVAERKRAYEVYKEAYCTDLPDFVPQSDRCFHCHRDVFTDYEDNYGHKSTGERGARYITGCPHCGQTFCD
jgi:hypothetical protein